MAIAAERGTPARSRFLTAVRRKSRMTVFASVRGKSGASAGGAPSRLSSPSNADAIDRRIGTVYPDRQRGIRMPAAILVVDLLKKAVRLQPRIAEMLGR